MIPTIAGSLGFLLAPANAYVGRLICFYLTGSCASLLSSFFLCLSACLPSSLPASLSPPSIADVADHLLDQASFVLSLSLITSNTGGQTKKMIVSAVICEWAAFPPARTSF
jgi:hypothetical protein